MWSIIIKSLLSLAEKAMDHANFKALMNNADAIESLEKQLNIENAKPLDQQDDLLIPKLNADLKIAMDAFLRQIQLGATSAKST